MGITSNKTNRLKYKEYISSHINIVHRINSKRDIDQSISDFNEIITKAAVLATPNQTNNYTWIARESLSFYIATIEDVN